MGIETKLPTLGEWTVWCGVAPLASVGRAKLLLNSDGFSYLRSDQQFLYERD